MTKIDSLQNTPELMDISVIDINTWVRAGAPATDKTQSARIRGAIFVCTSHVWFVFYMYLSQLRTKDPEADTALEADW